jgi:hypothetical protein
MIMMIIINEREMSRSLCGNCIYYVPGPEDKYGTWCVFYKDIYMAIREGKITVQDKSEPTDRSVRYDLYGLVFCEGFKPK